MNPQQELPPNYLDEIAPQTQKRSFVINKTRLIVLIGILAVVIMSVLALIVGQINSARVQPWERLTARLASTDKIVGSSEGKIKNSQLRSTNSSLNILLTNTQRDLATPLATIGINSKKLMPSIISDESSDEMLARLEDARLNAKYDSTYAREMSYQLSNLLTLLQQLYSSSSNAKNQDFLQTTYDNFAPVQKTLSEFSASNE
jgi:signal transduction histidine kinase